MTIKVTATFPDGSAETFHCDDYGHSSGDKWLVLIRDKDPYVMLSVENVRRVSIIDEDTSDELH